MTDSISAERRSWNMSRIRAKDTAPELAVRSLVFSMGFRFRLHRRDLPGVPDLVFPGRKKIIFVHGCFWHGHDCQAGRRRPQSNAAYWLPKIERNQTRDQEHLERLAEQGWKSLVIWECEIGVLDLREKIMGFLTA